MLFKLVKINSSLCSFCKLEDEAPLYLCSDCAKTKHFWNQQKKYMAYKMLAISLLTPKTVCLGFNE